MVKQKNKGWLILGVILLLAFAMQSDKKTTGDVYYLDSMTIDVFDPNNNHCSYATEELNYYLLEQPYISKFPLFTLNQYPRTLFGEGRTIESAIFHIYWGDTNIDGDIMTRISYTNDHHECDYCMDYNEFEDCGGTTGNHMLVEQMPYDNEWVTYDVTTWLQSAYDNNKFFAIYMDTGGNDVWQEFRGEGSTNYAPYIEITFGAPPGNASCSDSDGGQNYYVQGTVSGVDEFGEPYSNTDVCDGSDVIEWYCDGNNNLFTMHTCIAGCVGGACNCVPDCGCAANTCIGNTCSDGCGGTCDGTKVCEEDDEGIDWMKYLIPVMIFFGFMMVMKMSKKK